jgi:RecT family
MDPIHFSDAEKASFRTAYAPGATDDQWSLFIQECERRALVPGTHVVFQTRNATEYNAQLNRRVSVQKVTMITTIGALRLISERSGKYDGHGPFVYHYMLESGQLSESKIPLGKIPHAVSVEGFRKDWSHPLFATARYDAYVQTKDDAGTRKPTQMWATRGEEQLAKCCEALMHRTVAPEECAGLLLTEELSNDLSTQEDESTLDKLKAPAGTVPEATNVPTVNQTKGYVEPTHAFAKATLTAVQAGVPNVTECVKPDTVAAEVVPSVPKAADVSTVESTSKPQPTVVPEAPKQTSGSGLFTEANRPDPAHETTHFPPEQMKAPALGVSSTAPAVEAVKQALATVAAAPAAVIIAAATSGTDTPASSNEYAVFINQRASKIIRDKLPKAGLKDASAANGVKNYLLKGADKKALNKISAVDFERLLSTLENATPEQARDIVLAVK